jgi:hypothetical protein
MHQAVSRRSSQAVGAAPQRSAARPGARWDRAVPPRHDCLAPAMSRASGSARPASCVRSTRGALPVFRPVGFPESPPEPGVPVVPAMGSPAVLQFDQKQPVQPGQPDGLDVQKVTGQRPSGLGAQERFQLGPPPRAAVPAPEVVPAQDGAHRGSRHAHVRRRHSPTMRTYPSAGSPGPGAGRGRSPLVQPMPALTTGRVRPSSANQLAVPTKQSGRGDQEHRPAISGSSFAKADWTIRSPDV